MHSLETLFVYKTVPTCGIQFKSAICSRTWTL